jgi:FkbM family methyltransferase
VAVSNFNGTAELYLGRPDQHGLATLDREIATNSLGEGHTTITVPVTTFAQIVRDHVTGPIDFLKIDVGGLERLVIFGADLTSSHPRAVVVEATAPNSTVETHASSEPVLLGAN